ncbi:MAG: pyruvate kinase [Mycobacterium sp.]|nr:MAG: pyruvate kinase [Mycobacterium sp.]
MNRVIDLAEATSENAGPKMGRLGELVRRGFDVPSGFVVTAAAYAPDGVSDTLAGEITAAYQRLCDGAEKPVVVRSSAVDEDGDKASFAGIYDSYLGVLGADPVIAAVHSCWAAQHGGRAVAYRERLGDGSGDDTSIAVGVMLMVPARSSGVAFTIDPVTGRDDRLLIEASWGFGEPVVQGVVTPDRIEVADDGRILRYEIGDKRIIMRYNDGGGMERVEPDPQQAGAPALTAHEIAALSGRVRAVAATAGRPVDCEWVIDDSGGTWIVQWRPVTALPTADPLQWDPAEYAARYAFRSA